MSVERMFERAEAVTWQVLADEAHQAFEEGDEEKAFAAFTTLRYATASWLLSVARREGPPSEAEDFVAEVQWELFEYLQAGKRVDRVVALLHTILRRRVADYFRKWARSGAETQTGEFWERQEEVPDSRAEEPLRQVEANDTWERNVNPLLERLPHYEREVLLLRYVEELSVEETAARVRKSPDQVKKLRGSAIKRLRESIEERGCDDVR